MKYLSLVVLFLTLLVAPARERGLKFVRDCYEDVKRLVAPARERGLKCNNRGRELSLTQSRSRKGAWIEIRGASRRNFRNHVAPARERGLKYRDYIEKQERKHVAPARQRSR